MTTPPSIVAGEQFRRALEVIREHKLDFCERRPALTLPKTAERSVPSGEGPVGGAPGDLWQTAADLRSGTAGVESIVGRSRERIEQHAERLVAFEHIADVTELVQALQREAEAGSYRGPLHGLPISVKDIIDVQDMPTTDSSIALAPRLAANDAQAVARLRAAGAVLVGKTVTHEFALGVTTPQSHNPWDEARIPGGSSGGSAISVVTGMALASLGTDTRASIRVPAALSGCVGFRPSLGLGPTDSWLVLSWSMDVFAPMARSVRDIALLMDVLTASGGAFRAVLPGNLAGLRVGYADPFIDGAEPGVQACFEAALAAVERAGGRVVDCVEPSATDLALCNSAGMIVSRAEAAQAHVAAGTDLP